jgi:DNA-binding NarL/FixJ family response regulator
VLLDLKMPARPAARHSWRCAPSTRTCRCCCASGNGDNEEAQGLISLGATGLLPKPYRIGELAEQISRFKR